MGAFGGLIQTKRGRNLQAKAQTGVQLHFTRIAIGDGSLSGQQIADLTALISQKKSLNISKLKTQTGGKAIVGCVLSNQDIIAGFYFREIGVFAEDPDLGEILYCYGNAGQGAEYIPAGGGPDIIEKAMDIITLVGNTANISATIESSLVYATISEAQSMADQAEENANEYTDIKFSQVSYPVTSVNNKNGDVILTASDVGAVTTQIFNEHQANDAIDAHNATNISVADTNDRFTGTNVEAVLNELFQFANNGKTDIATVIGSPATIGDTFATLKTHIQNIKNTLTTNLSAKGQSSVGTEALAALVAKVANISTGKKWASGNATSPFTTTMAITGLTFTPSIVIAEATRDSTHAERITYYNTTLLTGFSFNVYSTYYSTGNGHASATGRISNITSTGFTINWGDSWSQGSPMKWIAVE
jgi:hypothetical protein